MSIRSCCCKVSDIAPAAWSLVSVCAGYSAAYAQLHNAARAERDTLPEVADARADLAKRFGALAAAQPPGQVCKPEIPGTVVMHAHAQQHRVEYRVQGHAANRGPVCGSPRPSNSKQVQAITAALVGFCMETWNVTSACRAAACR